MRTVRDGVTVLAHDDEATDDSAMPRTELDGSVLHEGGKSIAEPPEDKALDEAPADKAVKSPSRKK